MKVFRSLIIVVLLAVLLSSCFFKKAPPQAAGAVTKAFQRATTAVQSPTRTEEELLSAGQELKAVTATKLSDQEIQRRQQLLLAIRSAAARVAEETVDARIVTAKIAVADIAEGIAETYVSSAYPAWAEFRAALKKETQEALKSAGCNQILDAIAPDQRPKDSSHKDEIGLIEDAIGSMRLAGFRVDQVRAAINWLKWADEVQNDAGQVASAVEPNPQDYAQIFGYPPVQRAAIAYARFCYPTPRPI